MNGVITRFGGWADCVFFSVLEVLVAVQGLVLLIRFGNYVPRFAAATE